MLLLLQYYYIIIIIIIMIIMMDESCVGLSPYLLACFNCEEERVSGARSDSSLPP